ncbi:SDR family NAD(P)-dependent oxidoreductase [Hydrogenophaga pseudoflava]|uniref:SDR family NAD(P)-dependent oxidoreductase n=1 Tax=Hydrogenophaga pseudoflava TaxID=47421 RepID=UPI0027E40E6E|nr:SDR family NAD(P)-dependent oxidoreductase [Hydrogenophaga pseudoflava]MDQ7742847.1 SDR family NAD(P)-dependent oxidoreductase [Hydrogenophaga pseudoflava]
MQDLVILTGASRGLGLAMARQLIAPGRPLLCLSRHANPELNDLAQDRKATVLQWTVDLADPAPVPTRLQQWLSQLDAPSLASATLVNNAGVIPDIAPLEQCPPDGISRALRVGLEAPMLLTAAFLNASGAWVDAGWRGPRKVLNISSGLGRRAMAAQAPYCAAKAGMDHFSRCVALDEARRAHGARIVSLAPGVVDTDMQTQLRAGDPAGFPDHQRFVELERQQQLTSPDDAAAQVLAWLQRPDFGREPVADVRG